MLVVLWWVKVCLFVGMLLRAELIKLGVDLAQFWVFESIFSLVDRWLLIRCRFEHLCLLQQANLQRGWLGDEPV